MFTLYLIDLILTVIIVSSLSLECTTKKQKRKPPDESPFRSNQKNKRKVSTSAESVSRKRSMAVPKPKTENKSDESKEQINDDQLETCRGPAVVFDVSHIITQKTMVSPPKTNLDSLREENPLAKAYKTKRIESKEKVEEPFIAPDEKIAQFSFYQMDRSELRKRAQ